MSARSIAQATQTQDLLETSGDGGLPKNQLRLRRGWVQEGHPKNTRAK